MSPCRPHFNRRHATGLMLGMGMALGGPPGFAQAAPAEVATPAATAPELRGTTLDGQPFDLAALRGKVVMVLFWSTDCAVCRDKMPELRANLKGWQGRPFELVGVSTDRDRAAIETHHRLVQLTVPESQRFTSLWIGDNQHRNSFGPPGQLPAVFLLDKAGRVVESHHGRVPAQTWDRIADLL
ncbi:MAG: TlpA family protein disulfide reductase [Hydrogenophaga sp.]|uniref:peroxiredoxin family protein n=1 Tax=Hydrogenophaga sp. TaxID=1904254 RepID=UPI00262D8F8B|nr:TlpA disulfide reductase family protein [Hydrogenophaga sp.]MCV0439345.1 TlpA family protein disulfide reductase [Hydrogenophaga sp.]